jgi:RES domain-containing protein
MLAYRLGFLKFCGTRADAFSGQGGLRGSGRWHHQGRRIIYTAAHQSLALLEMLVHLDRNNQLQPLAAWTLDIPDRHIEKPADLPANWSRDLPASRAYGTAWLVSKRSACLAVPSVIVPTETNFLINPEHPGFSLDWVQGGKPRPVRLDARLMP